VRWTSHFWDCLDSRSAQASRSLLVPLTSRPRASCCCFKDSVCLVMVSVDRLSSSIASLMSLSPKGWTVARSVDAANFSAAPVFSRAVNLQEHQRLSLGVDRSGEG